MEFNKSECSVSNKDQEVILKGSISKEDCYTWIKIQPSKSLKEEAKILHNKMSHMMLQHHASSISQGSLHMRNTREIYKILCVKDDDEDLMIDKIYGHFVLHMKPGVIKKIAYKSLKC